MRYHTSHMTYGEYVSMYESRKQLFIIYFLGETVTAVGAGERSSFVLRFLLAYERSFAPINLCISFYELRPGVRRYSSGKRNGSRSLVVRSEVSRERLLTSGVKSGHRDVSQELTVPCWACLRRWPLVERRWARVLYQIRQWKPFEPGASFYSSFFFLLLGKNITVNLSETLRVAGEGLLDETTCVNPEGVSPCLGHISGMIWLPTSWACWSSHLFIYCSVEPNSSTYKFERCRRERTFKDSEEHSQSPT